MKPEPVAIIPWWVWLPVGAVIFALAWAVLYALSYVIVVVLAIVAVCALVEGMAWVGLKLLGRR